MPQPAPQPPAEPVRRRRLKTFAHRKNEKEGEDEAQGRKRNGDRDVGIALADEIDDDLERVEVEKREEMVNSPKTSATEISAADRSAPRRLGITKPADHLQPRAAEATPGIGEGHDID